MNDATATIGTKLYGPAGRDAIHVAVISVLANERLDPGQWVGFVADGVVGAGAGKKIGIVDPFLQSGVRKGDRFWMMLKPRTITSLRHVWEHPDCPPETTIEPSRAGTSESMDWISEFAENLGYTGAEMIDYATDYLERGIRLLGGENLEGEYVPDGFWDHYQKVTGKAVPEIKRSNFFSCAC